MRRLFWTGAMRGVRAACLESPGTPLRVFNAPSPLVSSGDEMLIKVHQCSLNSNDVRHLECDHERELPRVPGYELAGEILQVGSDESDFEVGQRVVGIAPSRCGGLASHVVLHARDVWALPSNLSTRDAAALVCGHSTALAAFTEIQPLDEDDVVLVIAGAGGYGLAAVDVAANLFKSKVIALSDTEGKASLLRDRGAFAAFKHDIKHNYKEIMKATDNRGVDLIYDAVGGPIINTIVKCLRNEDDPIITTYSQQDLESCSPITNENKKSDVSKNKKDEKNEKSNISNEVLSRTKVASLTNLRSEDRDKYYNIVEQVLQFCDDGLISAHVSQDFNLDEINEAIAFIKGKMCTGKVVIHIND